MQWRSFVYSWRNLRTLNKMIDLRTTRRTDGVCLFSVESALLNSVNSIDFIVDWLIDRLIDWLIDFSVSIKISRKLNWCRIGSLWNTRKLYNVGLWASVTSLCNLSENLSYNISHSNFFTADAFSCNPSVMMISGLSTSWKTGRGKICWRCPRTLWL